jgi:hypothetical protein
MVPEREQVELQGFAFQAQFAGHVVDRDMAKIGLTRHRAQTREFRAVEMNSIAALRIGILERFQPRFVGRVRIGLRAAFEERQIRVFVAIHLHVETNIQYTTLNTQLSSADQRSLQHCELSVVY